MIVIADTAPINYLVLIGEQNLLPTLFGQVIVPEMVLQELLAIATPQAVRQWATNPPRWLEIRQMIMVPDMSLSHLDEGEREAIQLAEFLGADLLLVDEKAARKEAAKRHLSTSGTLGILDSAADKGLVDFFQALQRLKQTSFYISAAVEQFFLERNVQRKASK
jgi:predicted nucleic acid-binding protein